MKTPLFGSLLETCRPEGLQTQVYFNEYCKIFKSIYFEEHLRTAASVMRRSNYDLIKSYDVSGKLVLAVTHF